VFGNSLPSEAQRRDAGVPQGVLRQEGGVELCEATRNLQGWAEASGAPVDARIERGGDQDEVGRVHDADDEERGKGASEDLPAGPVTGRNAQGEQGEGANQGRRLLVDQGNEREYTYEREESCARGLATDVTKVEQCSEDDHDPAKAGADGAGPEVGFEMGGVEEQERCARDAGLPGEADLAEQAEQQERGGQVDQGAGTVDDPVVVPEEGD
jgi:hypothetical protein